uniref:Uncharacterized protein n=1 Tax=Rhizophora mucronata TaxID=61149 RepID=A0A2P2IU90_RHIMU
MSSTGVCAACKGSTWGPVERLNCWFCCFTEEIKLKKRGTNVPQPPSLNRILNE